MNKLIIITLWLTFSPSIILDSSHLFDSFVIWNVGQGQWTTFSRVDSCYHFDLGGEYFPLSKIKTLCLNKKNEFYISHWDLDHMSALKFLKSWPHTCRRSDPLGKASASKIKLLSEFRLCTNNNDKIQNRLSNQDPNIKKIFPIDDDITDLPDISNAKSIVYTVDSWLIPGDSRIEEEGIWTKRLSSQRIKGLVIGHHGSKTSSSKNLVSQLKHLQWAIASARWRRYKHPHPLVINRFHEYKKKILRTEDWGNFIFQR